MWKSKKIAYLCGNFLEVIEYPEYTYAGYSTEKPAPDMTKRKDEQRKETKTPAQRAAVRAQNNIRRICNAAQMSHMITLTFCIKSPPNYRFKEAPIEKQKDRAFILSCWKSFLKRLKKRLNPPQRKRLYWLLVLEKHDGERTSEAKKDTYHMHIGVNMRIDIKIINRAWRYGFTFITDFSKGKDNKGEIENPGAYLSKYVGKAFEDSDLYQKRYTCSRNCPRPEKLTIEEIISELEGVDTKVVFSYTSTIENDGFSRRIQSITYKSKHNINKLYHSEY